MILVDGKPVTAAVGRRGRDLLGLLLDNPVLTAASDCLKARPEMQVTADEPRPLKIVYVFQREYATVDPSLVQFVGTDEATTCVGLVIRNRENGMTSVGHLDFPEVVDAGISQMLSLIADPEGSSTFDVHLIGAFDDANGSTSSTNYNGRESYSLFLCSKIIKTLVNKEENFHLRTLCVLRHNTKVYHGNAYPVISGFLVDTSSGFVFPAHFDRSSRGPDEIIRRIRIAVSSEDPSWRERLLETYNTGLDRFQISPCSWLPDWSHLAVSMLHLSDSELLLKCSTSPYAEGPVFVENQRRLWSYLIQYPDWRATFQGRRPRIFGRTADGGWERSIPIVDP